MNDPSGMNRASAILKDGVALIAAEGPDSTRILGVGTQATVYGEGCGSTTVMSGFSIANEAFATGQRVAILIRDGAPTVTENRIEPWYPTIYVAGTSAPELTGNVVGDGSPLIGIGSIDIMTGSVGTIVGNIVEGGGIYVSADISCVADVLVESNWIVGTGESDPSAGIGIGDRGSAAVAISDNVITDKATAISVCSGVVSGNNLADSVIGLEGRLGCAGATSITATMNWWGTTDPVEIASSVLDAYDDPERPVVVYEPWCMEPSCATPSVEPMRWGRIKALYRHSAKRIQ